MSYPLKERPSAVTAAAGLLYLTAGLQVASLALTLTQLPAMRQAMEEAAEADAETTAALGTFFQIVAVGAVCIYVLLAGAFAILGAFVAKGKQPARITTWVIGGLFALCLGCGLAGNGAGVVLSGQMTQSSPNGDVQADFEAAMPGWANAASTGLSVLTFLALMGVIILLAVPAANDYFRKEPPAGWMPPSYYPPPGGPYPPPGYYPPPGAYPPPGTLPPGSLPPAPPAGPQPPTPPGSYPPPS